MAARALVLVALTAAAPATVAIQPGEEPLAIAIGDAWHDYKVDFIGASNLCLRVDEHCNNVSPTVVAKYGATALAVLGDRNVLVVRVITTAKRMKGLAETTSWAADVARIQEALALALPENVRVNLRTVDIGDEVLETDGVDVIHILGGNTFHLLDRAASSTGQSSLAALRRWMAGRHFLFGQSAGMIFGAGSDADSAIAKAFAPSDGPYPLGADRCLRDSVDTAAVGGDVAGWFDALRARGAPACLPPHKDFLAAIPGYTVVPHVTEKVLPAIRYSMEGWLGANVLALPDADGYIHVRDGKLAASNAHEIIS
jgi:hypothetical protein